MVHKSVWIAVSFEFLFQLKKMHVEQAHTNRILARLIVYTIHTVLCHFCLWRQTPIKSPVFARRSESCMLPKTRPEYRDASADSSVNTGALWRWYWWEWRLMLELRIRGNLAHCSNLSNTLTPELVLISFAAFSAGWNEACPIAMKVRKKRNTCSALRYTALFARSTATTTT